ncbi:MAG: hypothetical protein A2173_07615 [Planctomycetes bacterium RBG_13_44_8b]|nr:MAG: hypothetical protein A2173_07615 [Planctomycetes bacterium RBG_13_44_8b]
MDVEQLEKYSSAMTLSDMEVFVFPELMYSLVLANIMSPIIWQWRELDCFKKLQGKSTYRKLLRLRQFIMDEFEFNLDLETWGLTTKQKEFERFKGFISPQEIAASNGLFGYEGDKYYFDVDIRKHFGLDKYDGDVIPYWKTETVEAMSAFRLKKGYKTGAGECVSLSSLYAAAAFIVCEVPLENIYMILTPLHSQNFIDIDDGILTNNRRLVTKTMWFNGTEISNKAQRALRNEKVTIVAHSSGYIHCLYNDATINKAAYQHFTDRLSSYLSAALTIENFASFLRCYRKYQHYFQLCRDCHNQPQYLKAEVLFHYEHGSDNKIGCKSQEKLFADVSDEDFLPSPMPDRIRCDRLEEFMRTEKPDVKTAAGKAAFKKFIEPFIPEAGQLVDDLAGFLHVEAELPPITRNFVSSEPIKISVEQDREKIIEYLQAIRKTNSTADLAFYAYRDMESCDWEPFVKAAMERNPVSVEDSKSMSIEQVYKHLLEMKNDSIYDGKRLAQPDEMANYQTGDGLEKAFFLANIIHKRNPEQNLAITVKNNNVILANRKDEYRFISGKGLEKQITI